MNKACNKAVIISIGVGVFPYLLLILKTAKRLLQNGYIW